ncbi:MAG TPA: hypothetical protein DCE42_03900 [Myxococcales bacterium]|nr:hypothetical protein [Myxococcales bacterium]|tara:strand:- start:20690 stop:23068 length:2379 start_codon:yes stop_codon:yes gene_type:complete
MKDGTENMPCLTGFKCEGELVCNRDEVCVKDGEPGTGGPNSACQKAAECRKGYTCGSQGKCAPQGVGVEGDQCAGNENCREGLVCGTVKGLSLGKCTKDGETGTKQTGEECAGPLECGFGMICGLFGKCQIPQTFAGVTCEDPGVTPGPFRIFFEVPRKDKAVKEFYRLPFPNNIRIKNGKVDLTGHPNPAGEARDDLIGSYLKAIEAELDAFGNNQAIYFRFSQSLDFSTLELNGDKPAIVFVNLDTGQRLGISVTYNAGKGAYICYNSLSIKTFSGLPLEHGANYAVIITNILKNKVGDPVQADDDFKAMIAENAPQDEDLKTAYPKYQGLRDYLAKNKTDDKWPKAADIVGATVFTTQNPDKHIEQFRNVAQGQPAPTLKSLTLCDGKNTSPCATDGDDSRKCGAPNDKFYEFHAKVTLPIFQKGDAPYETTGGGIDYASDGTPQVVRKEDVCVSLTIPKGTAPVDGWPIMLYSHGTGGNYRGHVVNQTALRASNIELPDGKKVGFATIGFDQVLHGPRKKDSKTHPNFLFFNFKNPIAAKNNTIQGAADHFTMVRLIKSLVIAKEQSPTQAEIKMDGKHIVFFGHSQGGVVGPVFLPFEPDIKTVILSGAGGNLVQSLLNKTEPVNVKDGVKLAVGQPGSTGLGNRHPILNLLQMYFERSDAINYGHMITQTPNKDITPKHALLTYGIDDTFTPNKTTDLLALSMGVTMARPVLKSISGLSSNAVEPPIQGNVTVETVKYTSALAQYKPTEGSDGHFVIFQNTDAQRQWTRFLGTYLTDPDNIPTLLK